MQSRQRLNSKGKKMLKSPKDKGSRLERKVAKMIRDKGLDKKASRMPLSGAMPHLQADIYTALPIHIEAKNQERLKIWSWWQTLRAKAKFGKDPVLVFSGNHRPVLAVVEFDYLLNLMKVEQDYIADINEVMES